MSARPAGCHAARVDGGDALGHADRRAGPLAAIRSPATRMTPSSIGRPRSHPDPPAHERERDLRAGASRPKPPKKREQKRSDRRRASPPPLRTETDRSNHYLFPRHGHAPRRGHFLRELRVHARAPAAERVSWALYDFANTIFSMNIATLYFPVWIVAERGASATAWSRATSASAAVVLFARRTSARGPSVAAAQAVVVGSRSPACGDRSARSAGRLRAPSREALARSPRTFVVATSPTARAPLYNASSPSSWPPAERGRLSGLGTALG